MSFIKSTILGGIAAALMTGVALPVAAQDDKIVIGTLIQNTVDPFWTTIGCGAQAKADELGVTLTVYGTPSMAAAEATSAFNAILLSEPDGVFANPSNGNQFITQYQELMAAGVPVLTGNATDPNAHYQLVWSSAETDHFIDELLELVTVDEGKMVVLGGIPGLVPLESRYEPVVAALKEANSSLVEIERIYSIFDINKATSSLAAAIIANPDLKLIVASNGPDGIAAAAAVKAAGRVGDIQIIAFDAVPPEVQALKDGVITVLVSQAAAEIGGQAVEILVDYIRGGHEGPVPISDDFTGVRMGLLTADNVDAAENAKFIYTPECR